MSETLTQFGTSFQSKIIASLLREMKFIQTINDILSPDMFDSDSNSWLIKNIKDYYIKYKKQPTLEVLKYKVDEIEDEVLQSGVVDKLREVWKNIEATDLEFVQSETLNFCKNQTLKNAILESVELLENNSKVYTERITKNIITSKEYQDKLSKIITSIPCFIN